MGSSYSSISTTEDIDVIVSSLNKESSNNIVSPRSLNIRPPVHSDSINWLTSVRAGMVISCSSDKTLVLNNMDTGACIMRWRGHEKEVTKAVYKHIGGKHFILSASKDSTVRLWYFNSPFPYVQYKNHDMAITALTLLDDTKFVTGFRDGCIQIWDFDKKKHILTSLNAKKSNVITHIEYEPKTHMLLQSSEDGMIRFWDERNLELVAEVCKNNNALLHCHVCNNSLTCLTSSAGSFSNARSYGCEVSLWDLRERKLIRDYFGHEEDVRCSIFLPNQPQISANNLFLSVSNDKSVRLWNVNNGVCLWKEYFPSELNACIGSQDGSIAIGGNNATLCDIRLLKKAGKPYLQCHSIQSISH